ncbi:MAG: RNA-binding protein [Polaromonas sp.]
MKKFELNPDMLSMGGTFYPKGYAFIMFPNAMQAERVGIEIGNTTELGESVMFLNAATVLREIGKVEGESDVVLPSVGTEGATVRKYVDLARKGHCALMVKVDSDEEAERVMQSARAAAFSYGQRYHLLAMEDLE